MKVVLLSTLLWFVTAVAGNCSLKEECVAARSCPKYVSDGQKLGELSIRSAEYKDLRALLESQICDRSEGKIKVCCKTDGKEKIRDGHRVFNGKEDYPWMARLEYNGGLLCGGVVVDNRFVVTAKHCINKIRCFGGDWTQCKDEFKVNLRKYDYGKTSIATKTSHTIEDVFIPGGLPGVLWYDAERLFDMALIKLDKDLNDCGNCWSIDPISLAPDDSDLQPEAKFTALGWGTFDASGEASPFLRQVNLTLNLEKTQGRAPADNYSLWTDVGPDGQDTCAGDSGGPLITKDGVLVGILEGRGIDCAQIDEDFQRKNETGLWSRVSSFRNWILETIERETETVHGQWGTWESWTRCSKPCGGEQIRQRQCKGRKNGGQDCPWTREEDDFQRQRCNEKSDCQGPVSGGWTDWSPWTPCSVSCGTGSQSSSRECSAPPPSNGGRDCAGQSSKSQQCNENPCSGKTPGFIISGGWLSDSIGNHVEVYNPQSGSQCELPDLPGQRRYSHSMCGNLLCGGGVTDTETSCLLLDTSTGQFSNTSVTLRQWRWDHLCWNVGGEGGDTLIIGGRYSDSTTELVSSDGRTSSEESFTLKYKANAACGIQSDNTYIITGGWDSSAPGYALKKVTSYSKEGRPEPMPDLNVGRYHHACGQFVNNEGVTVHLVTGGYNNDLGRLDSTEVLEDNTWEMSASLPSARSRLRAASVANTIFVFGGYDGTSELNTILRYNDKTKSWEEEGQMKEERSNHAVEVLEDVSLLCP